MPNCKQGDLAVVVNHESPNYGKFVVVRCEYDGRSSPDGAPYVRDAALSWIVDGRALKLRDGLGHVVPGEYDWCLARDTSLRPIRDSDGEDEVLRIAGRPVDLRQIA